jgi:hypothetical protein
MGYGYHIAWRWQMATLPHWRTKSLGSHPETALRENDLGNMERPQRNLMLVAILMALLAAGAWTYRLLKVRAEESEPKGLKKVTLDLRSPRP